MNILIIFSGLPGTGKSTIAAALAKKLSAVYLRVDSLETALVRSGLVADQWDLGPAGYYAAQAVARDNLKNGLTVIADSVNPLEVTREAWRNAALTAGSPWLDVHIVCSDKSEHQKRVETRQSDIEGLRLPDWNQVLQRDYEPWTTPRFAVDTAMVPADRAAGMIADAAAAKAG